MSQEISKILLPAGAALFGAIAALATGFILISHLTFPPPEVWDYGLPFAWREVLNYSPQNIMTELSWWFLSLDVVFYTSAGYVLIVSYKRKRAGVRVITPAVVLSVGYMILALGFAAGLYIWYTGTH